MKKLTLTLGLIIGLTGNLQARTLEEVVAACEAGNAKMCIALGNDFKKRDSQEEAKKYFSKGIEILDSGCKKNNPDSCSDLAYLYIRGDGVEESNNEAKRLYEKSLDIFKKGCDKEDAHSCMMVEKVNMHLEML